MSSLRLNQLSKVLVRNYLAGVNTYVYSKPAVGKTVTVETFAAEMTERMAKAGQTFSMSLFYAPTMSPMDIVASAPNYETGKLVMYCNQALPNAYDNPDMKGCIFIDEMPNADQATLKLLQKYVNGEDMSGVLRKPKGVMVIAAGNRLEDKSGVNQHGRAYLSRFEQHSVFTEANDNIDYAHKQAWHPMVQTFFKENPALIDNYDSVFNMADATDAKDQAVRDKLSEEGKRGIWCNMRAWQRISDKEFVCDQMTAAGSNVELLPSELAGNIGSAAAAQYMTHKRTVNSLASLADIVKDPANVSLPTKMDEQYILSVLVGMRCEPAQLPQIKTFGERLPLELQAVILRTISKRKGFPLASSPVYGQWMLDPKLNAMITGR